MLLPDDELDGARGDAVVLEIRHGGAIIIDDGEVGLLFSNETGGFEAVGLDDVELDFRVFVLERVEQTRNQQGGLLLRHGEAKLAVPARHLAHILLEYIDLAQQDCDLLRELLAVLADPYRAAAAQEEVESGLFLNGLHGLAQRRLR